MQHTKTPPFTDPEILLDLANRIDGYVAFRDAQGDTNVHQIKDITEKLRRVARNALGVS